MIKNGKPYWLFEEKENIMIVKRLTIKTNSAPIMYKVVISSGLALRESPDYNQGCKVYPQQVVPLNEFIKSTNNIVGEHGDTFVQVSYNNVRGWIFVTRNGKACLEKVNPPAEIVVNQPGKLLHLALSRCRDHWVLVQDNLTRTAQSSQWGNKNIHGLRNVFDTCANNERRVNQFVISQDGKSWCCKTTDSKGNNAHWTYDGMTEDFANSMSKLSVKTVVLGKDAYTYCILFQNGGYNTKGLSRELLDRMQAATSIKTLSLFGNNEYYIEDDKGGLWSCSDECLSNELRDNYGYDIRSGK